MFCTLLCSLVGSVAASGASGPTLVIVAEVWPWKLKRSVCGAVTAVVTGGGSSLRYVFALELVGENSGQRESCVEGLASQFVDAGIPELDAGYGIER